MVERQLPKLHTRVRFPSPAPANSITLRPSASPMIHRDSRAEPVPSRRAARDRQVAGRPLPDKSENAWVCARFRAPCVRGPCYGAGARNEHRCRALDARRFRLAGAEKRCRGWRQRSMPHSAREPHRQTRYVSSQECRRCPSAQRQRVDSRLSRCSLRPTGSLQAQLPDEVFKLFVLHIGIATRSDIAPPFVRRLL